MYEITITADKVKTTKNKKRFPSFFTADGIPKKIRIYDNGGETFDRFTICYTGNYRETTDGEFYALGASCHPFHPQGFGQHLSSDKPMDRPTYSHLGKKIKFDALPVDVQIWVAHDYLVFWGFTNDKGEWQ